jgi:hypothetical protein
MGISRAGRFSRDDWGVVFLILGMLNKQNITVSENKGAVSKAATCRHCEGAARSNPVITGVFRIASLRSQ